MKQRQWKSIGIAAVAVLLAGCEGEFPGTRSELFEGINGPDQLKVIQVPAGGPRYLAVMRANAGSSGTFRLYSLTDPQNPVLNENLTLEMPNNASDFLLEGNRLYVANRDLHRIDLYDFADGKFTPVPDPALNGDPKFIDVGDNPQRLLAFTRADGSRILVVVAYDSGVLQFVNMATYEFLGPTTLETDKDAQLVRTVPSTKFYMEPKQTGERNDRIRVSIGERNGVNINDILYLGDPEELFVTASFTSNSMFGFRLGSFLNTANVTWDLGRFKNGRKTETAKFPGSEESGFRGIAQDDTYIYASSRTDDSVYKIPKSEFQEAKDGIRNTRGFPESDQRHKIQLDREFDPIQTDKLFPDLGDIAVNCNPTDPANPSVLTCEGGGTAATSLWTYGLESKRVYRVDLTQSILHMTEPIPGWEIPQKLIWVQGTPNLLYISDASGNTITILDANNLTVVKTLAL